MYSKKSKWYLYKNLSTHFCLFYFLVASSVVEVNMAEPIQVIINLIWLLLGISIIGAIIGVVKKLAKQFQ